MSKGNLELISAIEVCQISLDKLYTVLVQLGNLYFTCTLGSEHFPVWELTRQHATASLLYDVVLDYTCQARKQIEEAFNTVNKAYNDWLAAQEEEKHG